MSAIRSGMSTPLENADIRPHRASAPLTPSHHATRYSGESHHCFLVEWCDGLAAKASPDRSTFDAASSRGYCLCLLCARSRPLCRREFTPLTRTPFSVRVNLPAMERLLQQVQSGDILARKRIISTFV